MDQLDYLPPLLRCPLEVRNLIYAHLLVAESIVEQRKGSLAAQPDYYEYEGIDEDGQIVQASPGSILCIRNVNPDDVPKSELPRIKHRSKYKIRSGRFRAWCMDMTYRCVNLPDIDATILRVNRQVHNEAAPVLYSAYTFDFDSNIEACAPFFNDLTPVSREYIRRVSIVKKALPYDKEFDRCEWASMCYSIAKSLPSLATFSLGVVTGKPIIGIHDIRPYEEQQFEAVMKRHREEMQWVQDLGKIQGLQSLLLRACIEHCPPPGESSAMEFFVNFSASVEDGFAKYLESVMKPARGCKVELREYLDLPLEQQLGEGAA